MKKKKKTTYNAIDLFAGCGGLSLGMHQAGFETKIAVEIVELAADTFKLNHQKTHVLQKDIRKVTGAEIKRLLNNEPLHLLAGCPPCQGFSSMRRLNKKSSVRDDRNQLVLDYLRLVRVLKPLTIMMENVPGLKDYYLFKKVFATLKAMGYDPKVAVVNVKDYGVPQNRKRLVMVGSRLGNLEIAKVRVKKTTVRDAIGRIESIKKTRDHVHKIVAVHSDKVLKRIAMTPKNGGSRKDLPKRYVLACHKEDTVGFNDVYGRLRWDDYSTTITGGCLNPSKGRFLHPRENRCITGREAALLQSFPKSYKFGKNINKDSLALLIGNALPPRFSFYQSRNIKKHLDQYLG